MEAEALSPEEESRLLAVLESAGQSHLLEGLEEASRRRLLAHVRHLNGAYSGGIAAYVANARKLLQASARGDNPFEGCTPHVPSGERLTYGDERFQHLESLGLEEVKAGAFVLVAGGLGERLGFSGIKVALPTTVVTGWCYLDYFCRSIRALQGDGGPIPFVIMTSGDTHAKTVALLEAGDYFGLQREQVHVLLQEKVPCLVDGDARLARDPQDPGRLETKPHGHGDVHALLHTSGLARRFLGEGRRWLFFFQDTNSLIFKVVPPTLGMAVEAGFDMNSVAVPRAPKDAMGGIARLERADGSSVTVNVEYNQLDPMLRSSAAFPDGDVADASGLSPFPGNMNTLVLALPRYVETLERTSGIIAEFVNPKYADASKTKFKSSTRLECMMQDFPLALPSDAKVGFTMYDQWCSYSPVKNNLADAEKKFKSGNHPQSGTTGEADHFASNCRILRLAGAEIEAPQKATFNGIEVDLEARVVWSPQWAASFRDVKSRVPSGARISISQRSTLVLDGDITIENLELDGALTITAEAGCRVRIARLVVKNEGWKLEPHQAGAEPRDEVAEIRGFTVCPTEEHELIFEEPGEHIVDESDVIRGQH